MRLGPGRVAWRESEFIALMIDRIAERDDKALQQSNQSPAPRPEKQPTARKQCEGRVTESNGYEK